MIHGFLGTFHCVLYQSVVGTEEESSIISIAPTTFSVGMFSWFPLYFPLREPQLAPSGSSVRCNIWRKCDEGRVWYEWCSEVISEEKIVSVSNVQPQSERKIMLCTTMIYYVRKIDYGNFIVYQYILSILVVLAGTN